jgi:hypothetical protein
VVGGGRDAVVLPAASSDVANWSNTSRSEPSETPGSGDRDGASSVTRPTGGAAVQQRNSSGLPIRRVRHAEVVLVDDVCVAFDRYWLRLRWPGRKGGFAGYIALGKVSQPSWLKRTNSTPQGTYEKLGCYEVTLSMTAC